MNEKDKKRIKDAMLKGLTESLTGFADEFVEGLGEAYDAGIDDAADQVGDKNIKSKILRLKK